jgi:hypothetical protein
MLGRLGKWLGSLLGLGVRQGAPFFLGKPSLLGNQHFLQCRIFDLSQNTNHHCHYAAQQPWLCCPPVRPYGRRIRWFLLVFFVR